MQTSPDIAESDDLREWWTSNTITHADLKEKMLSLVADQLEVDNPFTEQWASAYQALAKSFS